MSCDARLLQVLALIDAHPTRYAPGLGYTQIGIVGGFGVVGLTHWVRPIAGCPRPTSNHRQALG
jgi:hypothetical protein